jgi:hypothetical protein
MAIVFGVALISVEVRIDKRANTMASAATRRMCQLFRSTPIRSNSPQNPMITPTTGLEVIVSMGAYVTGFITLHGVTAHKPHRVVDTARNKQSWLVVPHKRTSKSLFLEFIMKANPDGAIARFLMNYSPNTHRTNRQPPQIQVARMIATSAVLSAGMLG